MSTSIDTVRDLTDREYKYGFVSDIEADAAPPGLNEEIIRLISAKKREPDFMLEWRLKAYRHWVTMKEPTWPNVHYPPIDYQASIYYSAPKSKKDGPKSLDEVEDGKINTYSLAARWELRFLDLLAEDPLLPVQLLPRRWYGAAAKQVYNTKIRVILNRPADKRDKRLSKDC